MKNKTYNRKKIMVVFVCAMLVLLGLIGRLVYPVSYTHLDVYKRQV